MQEIGCTEECGRQAARKLVRGVLRTEMQEVGCAQTCAGRLRAEIQEVGCALRARGQPARRNAGSRLRANVSGGRLRAEMQEVGCAEACEDSGCTQKCMR